MGINYFSKKYVINSLLHVHIKYLNSYIKKYILLLLLLICVGSINGQYNSSKKIITIQNGQISPVGIKIKVDTTIRFTYYADTGYEFDYVIANGQIYRDSPTNFTLYHINTNSSIEVYFKPKDNRIILKKVYKTIQKTDSIISENYPNIPLRYVINTQVENGRIFPNGSKVYFADAKVRYTWQANEGYELDTVLVNGVKVDSVEGYTFDSVKSDQTLSVKFKVQTFSITSSAGNGGSISPQGISILNYGSKPTYIITPNTGYVIDTVFVNGLKIDSISSYTFDSVKADQTISVKFKVQTFSITSSAGNGGSIAPQGTNILNYGSKPIYTITPNSGFVIDTVFVNGLKVDSISSYTFDSVKSDQTISVKFKVQTFSITSSVGNGGSISPQDTTIINYGTKVQFTITPNIGYIVNTLFVNGLKVDSISSYTFDSVKANQTISVKFKEQTFSITSTAGDGGSISPQGINTLNYGSKSIYTITPNTGYILDSLFVNDVNVDSISSYTFDSVKANQTISVKFKLQTFSITSTAGNGGSIAPQGTNILNYGSKPIYTITPSTGFVLDSLFVNGLKVDSISSYTFDSVKSNQTISVKFKVQTFLITSSAGIGGSIAPQGTNILNYGAKPIYTILPNTGYILDSLFVNGLKVDSISSYTFDSVKSNQTISVKFKVQTFLITSSAGIGGSIAPQGTNILNYGAKPIYTILPNTGYILDSLFVNGLKVDSISSYTFDSVKDNQTISVKFKVQTFSITSSAGNGGSISPQGTGTFNYGTKPIYTITPSTGFVLDSLFVNGLNVDSISSYTFDSVKSNQTISVKFKVQTFSITSSAGIGGSIAPQGTNILNYGTRPIYTITPSTGFVLDSLFVNDVKVDSISSYTFDSVKSNQTISVKFKVQTFTITSSAGNGGSITPQGISTLNYGTKPIYTITPNTGYILDSLFVNGLKVDSISSYTFDSVKDNQTISVKFKVQSFTITSTAGNVGSIAPQGTNTFNYGAKPSYTITPNTGYAIDTVFVNGLKIDSISSYTFDSVKADQTISVKFKVQTFTITSSAENGGSISPQGTSIFNYGAKPIYTITPSTGFVIDSLFVNGLKVDSITSYTFDSVKSNQTISVKFKVQTYSITSSAGNGGSISPQGINTLNYGSKSIYTITPNTGYILDSLFVNGLKVDSISSYTFDSVKSNQTISVKFKLQTFSITSTAGNGGSISPQGISTLNYGSKPIYTITPNRGFVLDSLFVNDVKVDSISSYTFDSVKDNQTISVKFKVQTYSITSSAGNGGSISPQGINTLNYGTKQSYTITPYRGYVLDTLFVNGLKVDSISSYTFDSVKSDQTISVKFKVQTFTINSSAGNGGSITPQGISTLNYGTKPTYTITQNTGYILDSLIVNGLKVDSISSYTFDSVKSDQTISVKFKVQTFTINSSAGNGGSITPQGISTLNYGTKPTYTITQNTGYILDSLIVNGLKVDSISSYTFDSVKSNQTISVKFKVQTFTITSSAGDGGSISPQGASIINYGAKPSYTITPNRGFVIDTLFVNGLKIDSISSYTFDSVKSNQTISVKFKVQTFTITSSAGNGGSITPQGISTLNYGTKPTYTITPNTGYILDSLFVNGLKVDSISSYTFDSVKSNQTISVKFKVQTFTITSTAGNGGSIAPQGTNTFNYGTKPIYTITPNTGFVLDSLLINGLKVDSISSYTFDSVKANQTISVKFKVQTFSITSSVGNGGSITPQGISIVNYGSKPSYTITPSTGFVLDSLFVNDVKVDSISSYTFDSVKSNQTISVKFKVQTFTITSTAGNGGSISPLGASTFNYGSRPIYTITPNTGFILDTLFVNGVKVDSISSYTFDSVKSNQSISVKFKVQTFTINSSAGNGGSIIPQGTNTLNYGSKPIYTITPNTGFVIDTLFVNGVKVDSISSYTFDSVKSNQTISVKFKVQTFTITSSAGNGGSITPQGISIVNYGSKPSYTITPSTGFVLDSLFVNDVKVDSISSYTFDSVKSNQTISVKFKVQTFTITSTAGNGGSISPLGASTFNYGSRPIYTITPNRGFILDSLFVNGLKVDSISSYTFDSVKSDQTISVKFKVQTFSITSSAGNGGSIAPQGTNTLNYGTRPIYTITPNRGFVLDSLFVNDVKVDSISSYTFDSVNSNQTLSVKFKIQTFTITTSAGNGGSIAPQGTNTLNYGSKLIYTITPNTGYILDSLFVNGLKVDSIASYTFDSVKSNQTISVKFKVQTFTITSTVGNGGSITPLGASTFNYGAKPIYTITPNTGFVIDTLFVNGLKVDSITSYTFDSVKSNQTISVKFKVQTFTISSSAGNGGSISPQGISILNYGTRPIYTITPNTGFVLDTLFVNGLKVDSISSYTFDSVKSNQTISVKFKVQTYSITSSAGNGGSIAPQGTNTLNYGTRPIYTITPNRGFVLDSLFVNDVKVDSISSYTFDSVKSNQTIAVKFRVQTFTIISSAGNGGSIAPQGTSILNYGAKPIYTITPNTGYILDSLFVNGLKVDSISSYTFDSVNSNQTISVKFKVRTFSITSSAGIGGSISPQGTNTLNYGTKPTYTITQNTGYILDSLFVNGLKVDSISSYTFDSVKFNQTISVKFKVQSFTITSTAGNGGSISPLGASTFNYGSRPIYTITPNRGFILDSLFVNGLKVDSISSYTFDSVKSNQTISVKFKVQTYSITSSAGNGGSISPQGISILNYGSKPTYIITPNTGFDLDTLFVNGLKVDSITSYTFDSVKSDQTISVKFMLQTFTVTAIAGMGGIISPLGINTVNYGLNTRFIIAPDTGFEVDSVLVNGIKVDSLNGYTFLVNQNITIKVIFKLKTYSVEADAVNGTISSFGIVRYDSNTLVRYTWQADTDYILDSVIVNGNIIDSVDGYTFFVRENNTIKVKFKFQPQQATIGSQIWMSRNLNVNRYRNGDTIPEVQDESLWSNLSTGAWIYYNNDNVNSGIYGKLYNWYAVNDNRGLCPVGWHIPTDTEWTNLNDYLGGYSTAGYKMKSINGWENGGNGDNSSEFNAFPGGLRFKEGFFYNVGSYGVWWSSTKDGDSAWYRFISNESNYLNWDKFDRENGLSVRCIKDYDYFITASAVNGTISFNGKTGFNNEVNPTIRYTWQPNEGYSIDSVLVNGVRVDSINGYTFTEHVNSTIKVFFKIQYAIVASTNYGTIRNLGTYRYDSNTKVRYTWQAETDFVLDSVIINGIKVDSVDGYTFFVRENNTIQVIFKFQPQFVTIGTQKWMTKNLNISRYRNGDTIPEVQDSIMWSNLSTGAWVNLNNDTANGRNYGKLYNGYAVVDSRGLCPRGWHVSSNAEWSILTNYLGVDSIVGYKIKSSSGWGNEGNGDNSTGFNALPGGMRLYEGAFYLIGNYGVWWTSTIDNDSYIWYHYLNDETNYLIADKYVQGNGFSVRCIKDYDYFVTASAINGTITLDGTTGFNDTSVVRYTWQANTGYQLDSVFVNGVFVDSINGYTFLVNKNNTIKVLFKIKTYLANASAINGTISSLGTIRYDSNTSIRYTWQANLGYELDSVIVNGIKIDSINGYTFSISENTTIRVSFKIKKFTLTSSAINGIITPIGTNMYDSNTKLRYTWQVNKGYVLDSVIVNGIKVDSTLGYTLLVSKNTTILVKYRKWGIDSVKLLNIIEDTTAEISVKILDSGVSNIIKKGIIWDTTVQVSFTKKMGITNKGVGINNFKDTIKPLQQAKKYFYRAYLINAKDTAITNVDSFISISSVTIGTQTWMTRNLNVSTYQNGNIIPQIKDANTWANLNTGAWSNFNNDSNLGTIYGKLYNWYAVSDSRGLCPLGWNVPTDGDFITLTNYLGGANIAGYKLKSTTGWGTGNGDNSSGFNLLSNGIRDDGGFFDNTDIFSYLWTNTNNDNVSAWTRNIYDYVSFVNRSNQYYKFGFAVRCLKDHGYYIISNASNGIITPQGTNKFDSNSNPRFTWKANLGYEFDSVVVNGIKVDSINGYTFKINENSSIIVSFKIKKYTVNASVINGILTPIGATSYDSNTKVRYTWQANTGYVLDSVIVNGIKVDSTLGYTLVVSKNTNLVVKFRKKPILDTIKFIEILDDSAATISVKILDSGASNIIKKGIIWDTTKQVSFTKKLGISNNGAGISNFIDTLNGLQQAKKYFYRVYLINKKDTSFSDIDSFVAISTVTIGTQTWMARNLNVRTYKNGEIIPEVQSAISWIGLSTGGWVNLDNSETLGAWFGKLYNWYAVNDPRGLCPVDWHVPTDADFTTLTDYLGGESMAGYKLKSTTIWNSGIQGDNSSGFNAYPVGYRYYSNGVIYGLSGAYLQGSIAFLWSSSFIDYANVSYRNLYNGFDILKYTGSPKNGLSVRCIKDHGFVITANATNGTITPQGTNWYDSNSYPRFTWQGNSGYEIDSVIVNGIKVDSIDGYTFTINEKSTIRLTFKLKKFTVNASAVNGIITPIGINKYDSNSNVRYTWQAIKGYLLDSVFVNGVKVDSTKGYTLLVSKNSFIVVKFKKWTVDSIKLLNILNDSAAVISVKIIDTASSNIIKKGIIWDTTLQISFTKKIGISNKGAGISNFIDTIKNLQPYVKYYYRGYLINSKDTAVSNIDSFVSISTVTIGSQVWMARNLNVSNYKNGDAISQVLDGSWNTLNTGAWCNYNNNPTFGARLGKLYNWYAVNDSRGLCPVGWHVPTVAEFIALSNYLGGENVAGNKIKSTTGWYAGTEGNNSSGFNALVSGFRHIIIGFSGIVNNASNNANWWTLSNIDNTNALYRYVGIGTGITQANENKKNGFAVRCLQDHNYTIIANAINGTITPTGTNMYDSNISVRYTWKANGGYELDSVIVNGVKVDSVNGYTFTIKENSTIKVVFKIKKFTVTSSVINGIISPVGISSYDSGTKVRYTWQVNTGYVLDSVNVNGIKVDSILGYTLSVSKNTTMLVKFRKKPIVDSVKFIEIMYDTAAIVSIKIGDTGASNILKKGVIWDTTTQVSFTKKLGITNYGAGIGDFIDTIKGLQQAKKYYYRGYIINKKDTAISYIDSFVAISYVTIGTQTWMARNLNVNTYQNGDIIPEVQASNSWVGLNSGAWCNYENDALIGARFGKLYNWYTVNDPRGLCPVGWHVPTDADFTTLSDYLGGENVASYKLKSTIGWLNSGNGDNSSGFNGFAGGYRYYANGNFGGIDYSLLGNNGSWWTSSMLENGNAWGRFLYDFAYNIKNNENPKNGFSVRCIKEHGYTVTAIATNGIISKLGTYWYDSNTNIRYTWEANSGYELDSVIVNGIKVDSINGYSFTIRNNNTIKVVFKIKKYTVTASAINGIISPMGTNIYDSNSMVRYTWQSNKGYAIDSVFVNGIKVDSTIGYTLFVSKNSTIIVKCRKWNLDSVSFLNILNDTAAIISVKMLDSGNSNLIKKGIIWDTTIQVSFNKKIGISNKGRGISNFIDTINGLQQTKKYYYRGYLINSKDTLLSKIDSFISLSTITIGTQVWMARNLNVSTYKNGDIIPQIQDDNTWINLSTGSWCNYENNALIGAGFGKLYNSYAVNDNRGLCPVGWHVPSEAEFTTLSDYLGGENVAGYKLKSTVSWLNSNGDNSSGFNALAGGFRFGGNGIFIGSATNFIGSFGYWWTSSNKGNDSASYRYLKEDATFTKLFESKKNGFSVRCLKDDDYYITANATNGTISPIGTNKFNYNTKIRYTWQANAGYELDSVIVNGMKVDSINGFTFELNGNIIMNSINVFFKLKTFNVVASALNGVITPIGTSRYDSNTKVRYTWQSNSGYELDSVIVNGIKVDSINAYTLTIKQNSTIKVVFKIKKYTVIASALNGIITPIDTNRYDSNTKVRYTWQANKGSVLDSVIVNGIKVDSTLSYTLVVFENSTIIVKFRKKPAIDTIMLLDILNDNAAVISVNILDSGSSNITNKGIIWGLTNKISFNNNIGISNKGGGIDNFIDTITGLQQAKMYYYRAYLINNLDTTIGNLDSVVSISTVTIGSQVWMARNLEVNTYNNGDIIPEVQADETWFNSTSGAWSYYDNDSINNGGYGKLYNWYTVIDGRGVCPVGWRVPSLEDWGVLSDYLGGADTAGYKIKSTNGWYNGGNGDNSSGFNALPAGLRFNGGVFSNNTMYGVWWTSSSVFNLQEEIYYNYIFFNSNYLSSEVYELTNGLSIRCIKN